MPVVTVSNLLKLTIMKNVRPQDATLGDSCVGQSEACSVSAKVDESVTAFRGRSPLSDLPMQPLIDSIPYHPSSYLPSRLRIPCHIRESHYHRSRPQDLRIVRSMRLAIANNLIGGPKQFGGPGMVVRG